MRVIEPARGVGALDDIVGGTIKPAALLFGGADHVGNRDHQ